MSVLPETYVEGTLTPRIIKRLECYAKKLGAVALSVADASPFYLEEQRLEKRRKRGWCTPFEENDPRKRCYPEEMLPGARSFIAIAVPYGRVESVVPPPDPERPRGRVSRYSWGEDYHRVLHRILKKLVAYLQLHVSLPFRYRIMVDTGPAIDRAVAERSGLGWIGKNCCVIVPEAGSWVFLGQVLTTLALPETVRTAVNERARVMAEPGCGDCDLCLTACPTDALVQPYVLNPHRCLAYVTQMPGDVPRELRAKMGDQLWGCDICQQVCPKNKALSAPMPEEFMPRGTEQVRPYLDELATMTKSDFKRRFYGTAASWRGKKTWQRNATIAMGNRRNRSSLPALSRALENGRAEIRVAAAWALGRLHSLEPAVAGWLRERLEIESDERVRTEIETVLRDLERATRSRLVDRGDAVTFASDEGGTRTPKIGGKSFDRERAGGNGAVDGSICREYES